MVGLFWETWQLRPGIAALKSFPTGQELLENARLHLQIVRLTLAHVPELNRASQALVASIDDAQTVEDLRSHREKVLKVNDLLLDLSKLRVEGRKVLQDYISEQCDVKGPLSRFQWFVAGLTQSWVGAILRPDCTEQEFFTWHEQQGHGELSVMIEEVAGTLRKVKGELLGPDWVSLAEQLSAMKSWLPMLARSMKTASALSLPVAQDLVAQWQSFGEGKVVTCYS